MKQVLFFIVIAMISSCATMQTKENLSKTNYKRTEPMDISMYPKADANQVRHIIELAPLKNEETAKVEIYLCKEMEVDCNIHRLEGSLAEKELSGWGYNYYVFETKGKIISTLMNCPDGKLTKKDVVSESKLLRYNSKLPIVVYSPKGYKAKYKIWLASPKVFMAQTR